MLKGKNVLISGASRGIGKAIAIKFAENGASVGINYVSNENEAKETLKTIKDNGGSGILLNGDVSKPKDVKNIVNTFIDKIEKDTDRNFFMSAKDALDYGIIDDVMDRKEQKKK